MRCSIIAFALCLCAPAKLLSEIVFTTVALSGQAAPGAPAGVTFDTAFFYPLVNDAGGIAFRTRLVNPVGPSRDALFSGTDTAPTLLARVGDQAPGLSAGVVFQTVSDPDLNAAGQIAFFAWLGGTGVTTQNDRAIFYGSSAAVSIAARKGNPAATLNSAIHYGDLSTPALADDGSIAFSAKLVGTTVSATNDSAIFLGKPAALAVIAREGDQLPTAEAGAFYDDMFSAYGPTLNNAGAVAYNFNLIGAAITTANDRALLTGNAGTIGIIAREGSQAPSSPTGVVYGSSLGTKSPSLNDVDQVAFTAALSGTWTNTTSPAALFVADSGSGAVAARVGDDAPALPAGTTFASFPYVSVALNERGQIAFVANLSGTGISSANDAAIYAGAPGQLTLVARKGDQAAGLPEGVTFDSFEIPGINRSADVAFVAHLAGTGVTSANDQALYVFDANGLLPVARDGDLFEVGPADIRTIAGDAAIWFASGAGENSLSGLGNDRRLAFSLRFTDGSLGLFVARILEPASVRAIEREANGDVQVTVASLPNLSYTLQANDTLNADSWSDVATSTGTGADLVLTDNAPLGARRFYRVVTVSP